MLRRSLIRAPKSHNYFLILRSKNCSAKLRIDGSFGAILSILCLIIFGAQAPKIEESILLVVETPNKMPNMKGGKNYKKMKHAQDVAPELHEIGPGQQIGRVLRLLGDRQLSIYCNDNVERICRIRGKLHKRVWINTGDIVLVSRRDFTAPDSDDSDDGVIDHKKSGLKPGTERGDVLAKYDPAVYSKLRKMDGINYHLFNTLESNGTPKAPTKNVGSFNGVDDDDGFMFEAEAEAKKEEDSEEEDAKKVPWKRSLKKIDEMKDEDVNIDEI